MYPYGRENGVIEPGIVIRVVIWFASTQDTSQHDLLVEVQGWPSWLIGWRLTTWGKTRPRCT